MKPSYLQLYEYHNWANQKLFAHLKKLPSDICHQEIQSVFPCIYDALAHLYRVDNTWLMAMAKDETIMGKIAQIQADVQGKSLEELETMFQEVATRYEEFFRQHDMDEMTDYSHPQHGTLKASYADIIQHVVNHGTYHRGNITAMLRQLGHASVATDYVFYLFGAKRS